MTVISVSSGKVTELKILGDLKALTIAHHNYSLIPINLLLAYDQPFH